MTLDEWKAAGEIFQLRAGAGEPQPIFFRRHGAGPAALLLIHGFPTASWDWEKLWPELCARFPHVIALDMLGFGFSAKPPHHDYTLVEQASLHLELLKLLEVTNISVLAHDYGVSVVQELLARQLESGNPRLELVVLLNGGLFPETHRPILTQKLLLSLLGPLLGRLMSERSFGRSFSQVFGADTKPSQSELHDFWRLLQYNQGARIFHRLIRYIPERRAQRERWVSALQKTKVPIRLINGSEDPVSGAHMVARYRELIANPDIVALPGIGHYPQVEAPEQVLKAFLEFHHL